MTLKQKFKLATAIHERAFELFGRDEAQGGQRLAFHLAMAVSGGVRVDRKDGNTSIYAVGPETFKV